MSKKNQTILDGAYEVLHVVPGPIGYKRNLIDLRTISVQQAEELIKQGFPYLKKVIKAKEPSTGKS